MIYFFLILVIELETVNGIEFEPIISQSAVFLFCPILAILIKGIQIKLNNIGKFRLFKSQNEKYNLNKLDICAELGEINSSPKPHSRQFKGISERFI
jgi:hypothetical protein